MDIRKTLVTAIDTLNSLGVSYALIGGFALAAYGQHRATYDIDLLVDGSKAQLVKNA